MKKLKKLILFRNLVLASKISLVVLALFIIGICFFSKLGMKETKATAGTLTCSLSLASINANAPETVNATVSGFTASSVYATVEKSDTLLLTLPLIATGGGNYSASFNPDISYIGQDEVRVFAVNSVSGQTVTCNTNTGVTWDKKSENDVAWESRFKHQMVSFNNKLWIIGGVSNEPQSDVWSSTDGLNWTLVLDDAPWGSLRADEKVIVFDNKLWLMGGYKLNSAWSTLTFYNDVWSSSDGINWTQETAAAGWSARSSFALTVFDNKMWLAGGCFHVSAALACDDTKNDVWSSSNGIDWIEETVAAGWAKRASFKMLTYDDGGVEGEQMWIMGGLTLPGSTYLNDVWSSTDGAIWVQETAAAGWETRSSFEAIVYDDGGGDGEQMWLMGGQESTSVSHNDIWSSSDGITWLEEKADVAIPDAVVQPSKWTHWSPRYSFKVAIFDDGSGEKLWLAGGYDFKTEKDVWSSSDGVAWTLKNTKYDAEFGPRFDAPIISYNNKLWLIGGLAKPTGITNDVWSSTDGINWTCEFGPYDVGTYGIACNNPAPAFSARFSHKLLVFDDGGGEKLWLIGGCTDISTGYLSCPLAGRLRDVWLFDGTSWTLVKDPAAWSGRFQPAVAVFAGKMWLMGGSDGSYLNDVYSSSDGITWTASPAADWPGRTAHSAVAYNDGTDKLWVMGGIGAAGRVADVWSSTDPATAGWVKATETAAWTKRYSFGLLNYDDKMWVFGGNRGGGTTWGQILGTNEVWSSSDGITWTAATTTADWYGRDFFSATVFDNKMWLAVGDTNAGTQADVWASEENVLNLTVLGAIINPVAGNPAPTCVLSINSGAVSTTDSNISLALTTDTAVNNMIISNDSLFIGADWETYSATKSFSLSGDYGTKIIYAMVRDSIGRVSSFCSDTIEYMAVAEEPVVPPTEPVVPPTEPVVPPIESVVPPIEPVVPPTEPILPSAESVEPSAQPPTTPHASPETIQIPTQAPDMLQGEGALAPVETPSEIMEQPITPSEIVSSPPVMPAQEVNVVNIFSSVLGFIQSQKVKDTSQNVVTPLLISMAALNTLPIAIALTFYVWPYLHLIFTEPFLFFFRRKRKKWGVIYDSLSKLPLGLAVVRLYRKADQRLIQTKVTDKEGRYLMMVKEPGEYYLTAVKQNYSFPTQYLKSEKQDKQYLDLYHSEPIRVTAKDSVITANIPLDPRDKKMAPIKKALRDHFIKNLRLTFAYIGMSLAFLVFCIYPTIITGAAVLGHLILFAIFRRLVVPPMPKNWGIIYDEKTKTPLGQSVVRIFETRFNKLLETQVTDGKGRYSFLVGKNTYQLLAEKQGYAQKETKSVDAAKKEDIVNVDIGLNKKFKYKR